MKYGTLHIVIAVMVIALLASAAPGFSQGKRVEVNPFFGYSMSDGVTIDPIAIGGEVYDAVNVKSGTSYGVSFGVFVNENFEIGFLYSRQDSKLEGEGTTTTEFATMPVSNYHGIFTYNFGDGDSPARPFLFGGIGATAYSPADANGESIDAESRLSSTWGAGVKLYPNPSIGFSVMARWTPTYIKSDPAGYWCGWYGCYVVGDTQYSNQFELSGGLSFRF